MAQVRANGIDVEYELLGPEDGSPLLLIMGLGEQLIRWPMPLLEKLVARGHRVIRFDNRDVGLSTHFKDAPRVDLPAIIAAQASGQTPTAPYNLDDMARDAVGLLDALGIVRAHVVGVSMGGMIAQQVAAQFPERVASLTSIMSTTGNPAVPPPTPEAAATLFAPRPDPSDRQAYADHGLRVRRTIGSPAYPTPEAEIRAAALASLDRAYDPAGFVRQLAAIYASGDRRASVRTITAPTMVFHGEADPLVNVEGGRDTAANIAGAELRIVPGMGHDLPAPLYDQILDAIERAVARGGG
jgi:pimeloyl-ACP methyl ester carboxylesterase